jgi:hypothetical protein
MKEIKQNVNNPRETFLVNGQNKIRPPKPFAQFTKMESMK